MFFFICANKRLFFFNWFFKNSVNQLFFAFRGFYASHLQFARFLFCFTVLFLFAQFLQISNFIGKHDVDMPDTEHTTWERIEENARLLGVDDNSNRDCDILSQFFSYILTRWGRALNARDELTKRFVFTLSSHSLGLPSLFILIKLCTVFVHFLRLTVL